MSRPGKYMIRLAMFVVLALLLGVSGWYGFCALYYGQISLQWNSNRETDLAGYKVYYGISSENYTRSVVIGLAAQPHTEIVTYKLTGLTKGQQYYITVTAYNTYGYESTFSNEVEAIAR